MGGVGWRRGPRLHQGERTPTYVGYIVYIYILCIHKLLLLKALTHPTAVINHLLRSRRLLYIINNIYYVPSAVYTRSSRTTTPRWTGPPSLILSAKCRRRRIYAIYQRGPRHVWYIYIYISVLWSIYAFDSDLHQLIFVKPRRHHRLERTTSLRSRFAIHPAE